MKKTLVILLVLFFAASAFAQESVWFDGSYEQALKQAKKSGKLLIIDFYSDG